MLRSAPIRGLSRSLRRRGEAGRTMWFVGDENLSPVVEGLLQRGSLVRRGGTGLAYADLALEGRAALEEAGQKPLG